MSPRRVPLPQVLARAPFSLAQARENGIGAESLRGADLARPHAGVRVPDAGGDAADVGDIIRRCAEYSPVITPQQFFSHTTAARLWGCPLPADPSELLHVSAVLPQRAPRRTGVVGHHAAAGTRLSLRAGFTTSDPVATWLSLGSLLSLDELVVAADHLVLEPYQLDPLDIRPYASIEELRAGLRNFHGRGARSATLAIDLARPGAESRPETLLRLLLQRAGLPEPATNLDVWDDQRRWLGRADLVYPAFRTVVEYDGDQHRTSKRQYEKDIVRWERFVEAGWGVVKVRSGGLFLTPDATVQRVRRALVAGGWRQ